MHYYNFNIKDYSFASMRLSLMEDLAFRRMLDLYYESEKPLPCELKRTAKFIGMLDNQEEIRGVLNEFWTETEFGWVNNRAKSEIDEYHLKADLARSNGKKGGRPKNINKPNHNPTLLKNNPTLLKSKAKITQPKANQEPITINQEPITNIKDIVTSVPKFNFKNELLSLGVDSQILDDWLTVRKKKRASNTKTAFKSLIAEITKSGLMVNDAIELAAKNSWSGFKAQWYFNEQPNNQQGAQQFSDTTMQNIKNIQGWLDE